MHAPVAARTLLRALPDSWMDGRARDASARALHLLQDAYPGRCATLLSSGTVALQLAILAAHHATGATGGAAPRVAAPAYACPDLGTAAVGAGAALLPYDTDPATLAPDLASVERALRAGATVVVVAHLFGVVTPLAPLLALAAAHGAAVVEDAAQHAGGRADGVRGGVQAPWGVLSFGRGKGLNAGGGGALLSRDPLPPPLAEAVAAAPVRGGGVRHLAVTAATALLAHPLPFALVRQLPALGVGATTYHPPGPLARPVPTMARLVEAALRAEPAALAARQRQRATYRDALAGEPGVALVQPPTGGVAGALREPVLTTVPLDTLAPLGVGRGYPRTLADYPELAGALAFPLPDLPGARQLVAQLHTLPTHPLLDAAAQGRVLAALRDALRGGAPGRRG